MNLISHNNEYEWEYYTPLFIDLIDNSNQHDYYEITNPSSTNIYPDDKVVMSNYGVLYFCIAGAHNTTQLKSKLLEYAEELGTNEKDINDYFAFYEQ